MCLSLLTCLLGLMKDEETCKCPFVFMLTPLHVSLEYHIPLQYHEIHLIFHGLSRDKSNATKQKCVKNMRTFCALMYIPFSVSHFKIKLSSAIAL